MRDDQPEIFGELGHFGKWVFPAFAIWPEGLPRVE